MNVLYMKKRPPIERILIVRGPLQTSVAQTLILLAHPNLRLVSKLTREDGFERSRNMRQNPTTVSRYLVQNVVTSMRRSSMRDRNASRLR